MDLTITSRARKSKSECKKLRRVGDIPAVIYSQGKEGDSITVKGDEYRQMINHLEPGTLSAKIFSLKEGKKERKAIIKDIQYNVTTYDVVHLDFEELVEGVAVNVKIPIRLTGVVDCVGVKLGGTLRQAVRSLQVRCLPKDMPTYFEIDVKDLNVGQAIKLADLVLPKGVRALTDLNTIAVVIGKR